MSFSCVRSILAGTGQTTIFCWAFHQGRDGKAFASILASMATVAGVAIAAYSLNRWQREMIGKRKAELALQALTTFDEVRDVFRAVRSSNFVGERQPSSRPRKEDETKAQQETRDRYYMAIERLINDNDVFARLQSLQYAFPHRYHIVWVTKYRYKVLEGVLRERIRTIIRQVCKELGVQIVSLLAWTSTSRTSPSASTARQRLTKRPSISR